MDEGMKSFPTPIQVGPAERPLKIAVVYSRPPLPMTRADQMTVAHLLDFLARRGHRVYLYTLDTGEPSTPAQKAWVAERCHRVHLFRHKIGHSLAGLGLCLPRGLPLQVGWFYNFGQVRAVRAALAEEELDIVYCYYIRSAEAVRTLTSGNHLPHPQGRSRPVSFLAMQLSQSLNTRRMMKNFRRWRDLAIFALECRLVRRYEAHIWANFHRTVLIGPQDLEEIKRVCREYSQPEIDNFLFGPHGVDIHHYAPRPEIAADPNTLVFCGVMGTNTNIHAITWFAEQVWPLVKRAEPAARLFIVGRRPTAEVLALATRQGITVTGEVPDPGDYIARAAVCINPMRAGAGMQNKLLEYLAMGKPVVATAVANEGIGGRAGEHLLIADSAAEFAAKVLILFKDSEQRQSLGRAARSFIEAHWGWEAHFLNLEREMYAALEAGGR